MSDHHDDFGGFDDHHEPLPFDDTPGHDDTPLYDHEDHESLDDHESLEHNGLDDHEGWQHDLTGDDHPAWQDHDDTDDDHVELLDTATDHVEVFPPALDVGELPEPVDGFPWIDIGSLGTADPAATVEHLDPVRPEELAAYAGEEIAPGQDPWAALADSDDPATSALARWWHHD